MSDWFTDDLRADGCLLLELTETSWAVLHKPPGGHGVVMMFCPCCGAPLTTRESAKAAADKFWPIAPVRAVPIQPAC